MADKQPDSKPLKMVLLGKTGAGKSASGNTILGKEHFEARRSSSSVTTKCSAESRILGEQKLIVVDTPGLFNTKCDQKELMKELVRFLLPVATEQTPDAFLWVIKRGSFTPEVKESMEIFKKVFEKATEHTIVLFTNGNEEKVKAFIEGNEDLKGFIDECNGVYHVFDSENQPEEKVLELVEKINSMVKRNGKPYSGKLLENAERAIEELKNQPEVQTAGNLEDLVMKYCEDYVMDGLKSLHKVPFLKMFLDLLHNITFKLCQG